MNFFKKALAFFIDLVGSYFIFGYIIAAATGSTTEGGFELNGTPAFLLFAAIFAYFVIMNKKYGGTLGKKMFGITVPKTATPAPTEETPTPESSPSSEQPANQEQQN